MAVYLFDMDSTLSLPGERLKHVLHTPKNWDLFYAGVSEDKPNAPIVEWFNTLINSGHDVRVVTGRPERTRDETLAWLAQHTLFVNPAPLDTLAVTMSVGASYRQALADASLRLYMRKDGWLVKGPIFKRRVVGQMRLDNPDIDIALAVDDDRDVTAMYRSLGIQTALVEHPHR